MTKRVCRDCPIPNCGAKYLVRLSNHLTDVHELDYVNRKKWFYAKEKKDTTQDEKDILGTKEISTKRR